MPKNDKWVTGALPKRPAWHGEAPRNPSSVLTQRLARANKKTLVGRPLAVALRDTARLQGGGHWRVTAVFGVMGLALILCGATFADVWLLQVGGFSAAIGGMLFLLRRSARPGAPALAGDMNQEVEALDAYLDKISPRLPQPALGQLGAHQGNACPGIACPGRRGQGS